MLSFFKLYFFVQFTYLDGHLDLLCRELARDMCVRLRKKSAQSGFSILKSKVETSKNVLIYHF